jgi:hypothetical protein
MRKFTAGDGSDSTAAVIAFLQGSTGKKLRLADLYLIGEIEDPMAVWLTSWPSPLEYSLYGTFRPTTITRGKVASKIGLEVATMNVTWSPKLTAFGTTVATMNPYQLAQTGFYDNWRVRIWRCLMPTPGDANTWGSTPWFGGRIADADVGRGQIKFTINSFLDAINQPVPPNVIELSNAMASYVGASPAFAAGESSVAKFSVVAPSSTNQILADCTSPTGGTIYASNIFQNGYIMFLPGSTLAGYWSPVALNGRYRIGPTGPFHNGFTVFAPFPFAPSPGDTFYASTMWPPDLASSAAGQYKGFPYVPSPLSAI